MEKIPDGTQLGLDLSDEHENYLLAEERKVRQANHIPDTVHFVYQDGKRMVNSPFGLVTPEKWDEQMKELDDKPGDQYKHAS